jgi:hypothetical protein
MAKPAATFDVALPVRGTGKAVVKLSLSYCYCQEGGEGLCKIGGVLWTVLVKIVPGASDSIVTLRHKIIF